MTYDRLVEILCDCDACSAANDRRGGAREEREMVRKRLAKWFDAVNRRRCDLIDKKYLGGGLDDYEGLELHLLEERVGAEIERVFSHPGWEDELDAILRRLEGAG